MLDHDEIAIAKIIGARMAEARELCKLPQHVAAGRLGVSGKALEQIENGIDVERIPLNIVRLASAIYDVSVDYLFGYSDDWEVAEETKIGREIGAWLHHQQEKLFVQWASKQLQLERQIEAMAAVTAILDEIKEVNEALATFKEMNLDFDRLPAGSMLQHRIRKASESAQEARCALARHKVCK